jgi:hypothetical protein
MKFFRLKDPVTGLYYCPVRLVVVNYLEDGVKRSTQIKSNLSKVGKIYYKDLDVSKGVLDHTQFKVDGKGYYCKAKALSRNVEFIKEYIDQE